jgi:hypothetical protein
MRNPPGKLPRNYNAKLQLLSQVEGCRGESMNLEVGTSVPTFRPHIRGHQPLKLQGLKATPTQLFSSDPKVGPPELQGHPVPLHEIDQNHCATNRFGMPSIHYHALGTIHETV